jgi:hypothetical protein
VLRTSVRTGANKNIGRLMSEVRTNNEQVMNAIQLVGPRCSVFWR